MNFKAFILVGMSLSLNGMMEESNMLYSIPLNSCFGIVNVPYTIIENYEGTERKISDEEIKYIKSQEEEIAKNWQSLQVSGYIYGPQQSPQASIVVASEALIPKLNTTLINLSMTDLNK